MSRRRKSKSSASGGIVSILILIFLLSLCGNCSRSNSSKTPQDIMETNYSRTQWSQRYTETRSMQKTVAEATVERKKIEMTLTGIHWITVIPTQRYLSTVHAEETRVIRQATVEAILTESSK